MQCDFLQAKSLNGAVAIVLVQHVVRKSISSEASERELAPGVLLHETYYVIVESNTGTSILYNAHDVVLQESTRRMVTCNPVMSS
jgi:hypothetical protein